MTKLKIPKGYTSGPWRVRKNSRHSPDECDLSICGDTFVLADVNGPNYSHCAPNADLIALAPAMAARIAELEAALTWQPIETAPHGVDVLLYCPDRGVTNKERIELGPASTGWKNGRVSNMSYHSWATHWMPLDAIKAPALAAASSGDATPSSVDGNPATTGDATPGAGT